jgi:hypothetical protein
MKKLNFKKLSLVLTAISTITAISTGKIAPAQASVLTKLDYQGTLSLNGSSLNFDKTVTVDNLAARLSDAKDSELTIAIDEIPANFASFLINITGVGTISDNSNNLLSNFDFFYNPTDEEIVVQNYDFYDIEPCLNSTCILTGSGSSTTNPNLAMTFNINQTASTIPESNTWLGLIGIIALFPFQKKDKTC